MNNSLNEIRAEFQRGKIAADKELETSIDSASAQISEAQRALEAGRRAVYESGVTHSGTVAKLVVETLLRLRGLRDKFPDDAALAEEIDSEMARIREVYADSVSVDVANSESE